VLNSFFDWLKENSHWSHWVGLVVAALALITGFWLSEKPTGEITLKFTTVKIAQPGVPGIKILDNSNNQITSNIFGTEIVIWNTGDLTLGERSDRIREPLYITFSGDIRIIDSVVRDTKTVDPNAVSLAASKDQLTVKWTQFDPGDAIKLFVIYTGNTQAGISYSGRFIGTRFADFSEFEEEYPGKRGFSFFWDQTKYAFAHQFWSAILLSCAVIIQFFVVFAMIRMGYEKGRTVVAAGMGLSLLLYIVGLLLQAFGRGTPV
jgi:hypothetical protein